MIFITKYLYFRVRKSHILCQLTRIFHGKFSEHIQCRMCPVFFDWKNSSHICQRHICLILEPVTQKIQIFLLLFRIVRIFSENAVPFINQDDKLITTFGENILHGKCQFIRHHIVNIRILFFQFTQNDPAEETDH